MKNIITLVLLAIFALQVNPLAAQDKLSKKEQRKLEKAQKKKLEKEQLQKNQAILLEIAQDSSFVIEANTIRGRNSFTHQVNPNTNFVKIDNDNFVMQTSNPHYFGYNGLGGVTITGNVVKYEVIEGKKNEVISIRAEISSIILGHSVVYMDMSPSGFSTARIVDNWGNRITFNGSTYALENSRVFQGQTMF